MDHKRDLHMPSPRTMRLGHGQHALFLPAEGPEQARILAFHGGGGVGGSPEMLVPFSQVLARQGALSIAIASYRVLDRDQASLSDSLEDAGRALAWCRADMPDTAQLFLLGASFGGLLALDAALRAPSLPAGFILLNPVTDIAAGGFANRVIPQQGQADLSPMQRCVGHDLLGATRCLIAHGGRDEVVPIETSRRFARIWPRGRCEMHEYPGAGHGFFNHPRHSGPVAAQICAFLDAGRAG